MRWKSLCGGLALLLAVAASGCKQRCFLTEAQLGRPLDDLIPSISENDTRAGCENITSPVDAPPTLHNLDRKVRYLSLAEAIAIALEQGTVGQPSLLFPGTALDNLVQFGGGGGFTGTSGDDSIRVLALDPARVGSGIEAALSKFDAQFAAAMTWSQTDIPIGTTLSTIQAGTAPISANQTMSATPSIGIFKPLATGGVAGITMNVPYTYTNLPARVNPAFQPQLQFQFEQPLLQGFGVEINQLRNSHPGSLLLSGFPNTTLTPQILSLNGSLSPTAEGILITRLRFDQQRAEFERNVNQMLLNVEVAYWNLYGSYWALYSREQGLRFAYESYKVSKAGYEAGRTKTADFYQTRGQYELFRAQRLQAIDTVLDNERQLRALLGMRVEDSTRLMPSDAPTLAAFEPDWHQALADALEKRPELYMARQDVKAAQFNVLLAKNLLLPDLRVGGTYDVNAIGSQLDGTTSNNAFRNMANGGFNNWTIGMRLLQPLGFRNAHAQTRQAQIALTRAMEVLRAQELKAQRFLGLYYRRISSAYEQIKAQRAQREAFGEQLKARNQEFIAGRGTLDTLLEAQRFWADALSNEYNAIVQYNNALIGFEYAKGTILQHDNVTIAEGALPSCATVRAVEHQRERTAAFVLRERADAIAQASCGRNGPASSVDTMSLPTLMQATPPLKDVPSLPPTLAPGVPVSGPTTAPVEDTLTSPTNRSPGSPMPGPRAPSDFGTSRPVSQSAAPLGPPTTANAGSMTPQPLSVPPPPLIAATRP